MQPDEHDAYDLATDAHTWDRCYTHGPHVCTCPPSELPKALAREVRAPRRPSYLAPAAFFFAAWSLGVWAHAVLI